MWLSTLEIGYLLLKIFFVKKIPLGIFLRLSLNPGTEFWNGDFERNFQKKKNCHISILMCSDQFARIFNLWNVLVFMILIFQICENLTESWDGVLWRSFWEKFSKNETCYLSIWRCPDSFALIFRLWKSILTKLFNN